MPGLILFGFALLFAAMWTAVSFVLSRVAGWPGLAARYPAEAEPAGERLIWISAQLGAVSFRSCLNITLSADGFYMVPALMFRLFMPPLLIPWSEVRFEGLRNFLFFEFACWRLGGADGPILCLWRRIGARFIPYVSEKDRADFAAERRFEGRLIPAVVWIVMALGAAAGIFASIVSSFARR